MLYYFSYLKLGPKFSFILLGHVKATLLDFRCQHHASIVVTTDGMWPPSITTTTMASTSYHRRTLLPLPACMGYPQPSTTFYHSRCCDDASSQLTNTYTTIFMWWLVSENMQILLACKICQHYIDKNIKVYIKYGNATFLEL